MTGDPIIDRLCPDPPEWLSHREVCVARNVLNTLVVPCDPRPEDYGRWYVENEARPAHPNNEVKFLIDGDETFQEMGKAILTATGRGDFIYLVGWWLDLAVSLGGTPLGDLLQAASKNQVEIRAMLWLNSTGVRPVELGHTNGKEVDFINQLPTGAAFLDSHVLINGSHHQKILIVGGAEGLIAFCGGIDINQDRVMATEPGRPMHDVHCRIRGPAAYDLLEIITERWKDLREVTYFPPAKQTLYAESRPYKRTGTQVVQIARTFGNGTNNMGIHSKQVPIYEPDPKKPPNQQNPPPTREVYFGYDFAPLGERTCEAMVRQAFKMARRFIYIEDQYFYSFAARDWLIDALANVEHITVLAPPPDMCEWNVQAATCQQIIRELMEVGGPKVRVFNRKSPGRRHDYIHAKTVIVDDAFAIIGSANMCRRSYTNDSEVTAGITEMANADGCVYQFAHRQRIALWAEHLNMDNAQGYAELADGVASAVHWLNPPAGANVVPYDLAYKPSSVKSEFPWSAVDPDGS